MKTTINKFSLPVLLSLMASSSVLAATGDDVEISGVIEAEYFSSDFGGKESGAALATFELGIDAKINENVDGRVLILHEDDPDPAVGDTWEVDEGTITLHSKDNQFYFTAGRMYLPFGNFETNMVSDPFTLEMGEIREAALLVGMEMSGLSVSVFNYNGETIKNEDNLAGNDEADQFGFAVGYSYVKDKLTLDVGFSYLNNIADTDGIAGNTPGTLVDYVDGNAVYLIVGFEPMTLIIEQVSADEFDVADLAFRGVGAEPGATNIELAATLSVAGRDVTVAIGIQETEEASGLGLIEEATFFAVSTELYKNTSLALELASGDDYSVADGGTGAEADAMTLQLAVGF